MNITLRNVPDFFFESSVDYFNRQWNSTLSDKIGAGFEKVWNYELLYEDEVSKTTLEYEFYHENTSNGQDRTLEEMITFLPGYAIGHVILHTDALEYGHDFTSFRILKPTEHFVLLTIDRMEDNWEPIRYYIWCAVAEGSNECKSENTYIGDVKLRVSIQEDKDCIYFEHEGTKTSS